MPTSFSSNVPSHTFYLVKGTQILVLNQSQVSGKLISYCDMSYFFSMNTTSCSQLGIYMTDSIVQSSWCRPMHELERITRVLPGL